VCHGTCLDHLPPAGHAERPRRGFSFRRISVNLPQPPAVIRAVGFIDGQNLYRHAKEAFGYHHPNYDPIKLLNAVCLKNGWKPSGVRFYTGVPVQERQPMWHAYWSSRLLSMRRSGIYVFSRVIRYRTEEISLPDGTMYEIDSAQEKGVDVRLAVDVMRLAITKQYDVAVIFSQDQDLVEVAEEIRQMSINESRWIKVTSAFPAGSNASFKRGIDRTDWFKMSKEFYDLCLDPHDYRPAASVVLPAARPLIRLKELAPY